MSIARARQLRSQMSRPEAIVWNAFQTLESQGLHFRRQVPIGPFYADSACHHPKLFIEIDGVTHIDAERHAQRDAFMQREGFAVLRIANDDVLRDPDGVVRAVLSAAGRTA